MSINIPDGTEAPSLHGLTVSRRVVLDHDFHSPEELRGVLRSDQLHGEPARLQAVFLSLSERDTGAMEATISRPGEEEFVLSVTSEGGTWNPRPWRVEVAFTALDDKIVEVERSTTRDITRGVASKVVVDVRSNATGQWHHYALRGPAEAADTDCVMARGERMWAQLFAGTAWAAWRDVQLSEQLLALPVEPAESASADELEGLEEWEKELRRGPAPRGESTEVETEDPQP